MSNDPFATGTPDPNQPQQPDPASPLPQSGTPAVDPFAAAGNGSVSSGDGGNNDGGKDAPEPIQHRLLYLGATVIGIVFVVFAVGWFFGLSGIFSPDKPDPAVAEAEAEAQKPPFNFDAWEREGFVLLERKDKHGTLGARDQKRLDEIVVEIPGLVAAYADRKDQQKKAQEELEKANEKKEEEEKKVATVLTKVQTLWRDYDGTPLPKNSLLILMSVEHLEEFTGQKDYMGDGKDEVSRAKHWGALLTSVGGVYPGLYDFRDPDAALAERKMRWERCMALVKDPQLDALFRAEVEYYEKLGRKPRYSAAEDPLRSLMPNGRGMPRLSFAIVGHDWTFEKSKSMEWINYDVSVFDK